MVALASLPYPFATFISYKAHKPPRNTTIPSSIRVPSSSLRRAKRKNYLRPKILKTLTKPYIVPLDDLDPVAAPVEPIEPNVEVPLEFTVEKSGSSFVEESEMTLGVNESARELVGFDGFSGRTIVRIVGSFVGLFILQTVVAVWFFGSGNSDEKNGSLLNEDRKKALSLGMQEEEAFLKNWGVADMEMSEMEAKITEIRKMAWEVREAEKRKKVENGEADLGSKGTAKKLSKKMMEGAKLERGLVQDSSNVNIMDEGVGDKKSSTSATQDKRKMNDHVASQKTGQPNSNKPGSKLPLSTDNEQEFVDPWWLKLPYVLVILMQNGIGDEAQRGFYNIRIYTDAENQSYSSYTVAFEDRNDARNFSYILESAFEDLPDAAVDIAPLSTKEFKEVGETLDNKVIVLRKGELKIYAGDPLADVEAALRSLVK